MEIDILFEIKHACTYHGTINFINNIPYGNKYEL
jgi:hypothetical protein